MEEVAFGLQESGCHFLWVVRATEMGKIPKAFERNSENGLVVTWCSQLKGFELRSSNDCNATMDRPNHKCKAY